MLVGTGGTTGLPKGVMLTSRNLETMTAMTLLGYPFSGRPAYLALAPLTHAAGVLCFPVMTRGGRIVVMPKPDVGEFIALIERERITHTFLPPTLIYMLLGHEAIGTTDLSSLQCFWYGAAPMSTARLEEALRVIGPMAQLFGQTEAPMMVSMLPPADHYNADGTVATQRLASAGRPAPLVTVGIMDPDAGALLPAGERGEIVVRGSLVMAGYYKNPEATAAASEHGWHHTGDIGYLDEDGYLFIVDRLKDMIITGGFNVYSAEVEQALMQHPAVRDCAVVGLPDDKWGERVTAVIEASGEVQPDELVAFVKARIGSVKAPKQVELLAGAAALTPRQGAQGGRQDAAAAWRSPAAGVARERDQDRPDAAGGTEHEDGVAALDLGAAEQHAVGGDAVDDHGLRLLGRHALRDGHEVALVEQDAVRPRPGLGQRGHPLPSRGPDSIVPTRS